MENIKQKYKKFAKYYNILINEILLKLKNKTNKIFLNKLNFLIKSTLFKHRNKTNNIFTNKLKFKVSSFNKHLISIISLLFIYLFYLLIPILYDKTWVQNTIEDKLLNDSKLNFSISSEISYEILPAPHFTVKDAKIFNDDNNNPKDISEIKELKIFISQKNLFNKRKLEIKKLLIKDANFSIKGSDLSFLNNFFNEKFSTKKIFIKKSNIFFKDNEDNTITIIKIIKSSLSYDEIKMFNFINFEGEVFNTTFKIKLNKEFLSDSIKSQTKIDSGKLKLNIFNESIKKFRDDFNLINGLNKFFINNSKMITNYNIKKNSFLFESKNSKVSDARVNYRGKLDLDPFHFIMDLNIEKLSLKNLINPNSILFELFKTKLLLNENISSNISVTVNSVSNYKLFDSAKFFFNIKNEKINFDNSFLLNNKIGILKVTNSDLFFENENLIFSADFNIDINDYEKFYSKFNSPKKLRKPIKKINMNIEYNYFENEFKINSFKVDNRKSNDELENRLDIFNQLTNKSLNNNIQNRNLFNSLLSAYDG